MTRNWWIPQISSWVGGKSAGARVIYIQRDNTFSVLLIVVFPKDKKENLMNAGRNAFKKRADTILKITAGDGYEDAV